MTWPKVPLHEVADIVSGATPKTGVAEYWDGDIPWVTPADLSSLEGAFIGSTPRMITTAGLASCAASVLPERSVLLSSRAPIGHVAINTVPMATNQGFKSLVPRAEVAVPGYLYHWLKANTGYLQSLGNGATFKEVSKVTVARIEVPLPPLDEQRRIAEILDRASVLCQKPRTMLASLDALIQAQFVEMFDGEYEQKPISDLCELLVDCVNRTAPTVDEETPYKMLRTTNVRHGRVNTTDVKFVSAETFERWNRRATPQRGDVILTREAPVGEAGILNSDDRVFLGQRLFLYRVDPKHLTPEFLRACFDSPLLRAQFDRLGSGSTVKHLPLPACQNFLIPSPPIEVQIQYSDFVRSVAKVAQSIRATSVKLDELFASLRSRAFSGQL
ncbi:restriction endonuclease subunit S [Arthrobacter sp. SLBN-53]|uniref:restriction endonuclease subunit S n=1 Tax=Arthrobacter sp. SLBN-53 TaxID=2768412 RepID=UPI001154A8C9|nr:restriction endonuclease subunit S [Arthrobacter sp. SLBN-53]TQK29792.1 type I restriction enzyme S subunit [Arthrobacter sp. SLBN-53]